MLQVARRLAAFHRTARRISGAEEADTLYADFADLNSVNGTVEQELGPAAAREVRSVIDFAEAFLNRRRRQLFRRHQNGWVIDGHGDLHSRNILLLEEPVIFDCIEFNDQLRTLDVLNEIAFFCMDLDYYGYSRLAAAFCADYLNRVPAMQTAADHDLFRYYRLYRANVRLKVNCLRLIQPDPDADLEKIRQSVRDYYALFLRYYRELSHNPVDEAQLIG
jgi:aminoglycoside phosphotransferase family enzyme